MKIKFIMTFGIIALIALIAFAASKDAGTVSREGKDVALTKGDIKITFSPENITCNGDLCEFKIIIKNNGIGTATSNIAYKDLAYSINIDNVKFLTLSYKEDYMNNISTYDTKCLDACDETRNKCGSMSRCINGSYLIPATRLIPITGKNIKLSSNITTLYGSFVVPAYSKGVFDYTLILKDNKFVIPEPTYSSDTASIIALYHLNNDSLYGETQTFVVDYTGVHNSTIVTSSPQTTGVFGGDAYFDNTRISIPTWDYYSGAKSFTWSFWSKRGTSQTANDWIYQGYWKVGGPGIMMDSTFAPGLAVFASWSANRCYTYYQNNSAWDAAVWHQFAYVWVGNGASSTMTLYEDGKLDAIGSPITCASNMATTTYNLTMGWGARDGYDLNSWIDEFAIYNRALSAAEILALYNEQRCNYGTTSIDPTTDYNCAEMASNGADMSPRGINMTGNILLYHFNNDSTYGESDTKVYDFSGGTYNGTPTDGAVYTSSGKLNGAYDFDGNNDYIATTFNPTSLGTSGPFTISFWYYDDGDTSYDLIAPSTTAPRFYFVLISGTWYYGLGGSYWNPTFLTTANRWNHIVLQYTGTNATVYQDNVEKLNIAGTPGAYRNGVIGISHPTQYASLNGRIDEFAIWNRSLSLSEIAFLYNDQKCVYWNVDCSYNCTYSREQYGYRNITSNSTMVFYNAGKTIFNNMSLNFPWTQQYIKVNTSGCEIDISNGGGINS